MEITKALVPKERPILFKSEMVRAILEGRKTQTRRVVNPSIAQSEWLSQDFLNRASFRVLHKNGNAQFDYPDSDASNPLTCIKSPYGVPGDRLWVRERFCIPSKKVCPDQKPIYAADGDAPSLKTIWKPSIHMPRWASRITLEVTDIRVERLTDISEADALAEGIKRTGVQHYFGGAPHRVHGCPTHHPTAGMAFKTLWEYIYGPGSWALNPWVWVYSFDVLEVFNS